MVVVAQIFPTQKIKKVRLALSVRTQWGVDTNFLGSNSEKSSRWPPLYALVRVCVSIFDKFQPRFDPNFDRNQVDQALYNVDGTLEKCVLSIGQSHFQTNRPVPNQINCLDTLFRVGPDAGAEPMF